MIRIVRNIVAGLCLLCFLVPFSPYARADVGLVVETPTGILGFLSDVGHSSVWISRGCLSARGEVFYCEGSPGIVLSSTAYWSNPGAAAIPAEFFFLGSAPGAAGSSLDAWNTTLAAAYPAVKPAYGRKYLGRVWRRGMRVTAFTTTPEEDRRVLELVEEQRKEYRYSYSHRNCAYYAQRVLQLYLGANWQPHHVLDIGVYTPRSLERALLHRLEADPNASFRVLTFPGTMLQSWRQPPRSFCEAALFDPKYAIPLLMYQPYIYAGFGACYGVNRLLTATWHKRHSPAITALSLVSKETLGGADRRIAIYEELTGSLPTSPGWTSSLAESAPHLPAQERVGDSKLQRGVEAATPGMNNSASEAPVSGR